MPVGIPRPTELPGLAGWMARKADPANESVTDSTLTNVIQMLARALGANDPASQMMGLMTTKVPSAGPTGGLAGKLAEAKQAFIKAYHGSPYDFDRFSLEHVGTGEGAQAYGHGLYFAENPEVAKAYRDNLAPPVPTARGVDLPVTVKTGGIGVPGGHAVSVGTVKGGDRAAIAQAFTPEEQDAISHIDGTIDQSIRTLREQATQSWRSADARKLWARRADILERLKPEIAFNKPGGRLYEVAIKADPERLLDWDKPLSQQSESVRRVMAWNGVSDHSITGGDAYNAVGGTEGIQGAARRLQEVPIDIEPLKGVRYLDQGSRSAGEGSRNYVIWDDSLIDILKKLGLFAPIAGAAAQQAQPQPSGVSQ